MAIQRAGRHRKERCAWCESLTKWQIVTGFGVIKSSCDEHKYELISFDEARKEGLRQSEERYRIRQDLEWNREPSIAEMDLGIG